jgi:DNA-binding MarR family transcriptional regulator
VELTKIAPSPAIGSDCFSRQADALREKLGTAITIVDELAGVPVVRTSDQPVSERDIRAMQRMRRNRSRFFSGDLFADPAWDILLDLYASELGQHRTTVTSLCHAAAVPATTALRWIGQLESQGLINRRPDPMDGRRQFLELSSEGLEAMNAYFGTVPTGPRFI